MDMIKCPDAASLKETGRFYLQVGYNELFALGQSAWTGAKYYPTEKRKKKIDETINIVDNVGTVVKSLDTIKKDLDVKPQGEEITNIIKYLIKVSDERHISVKQLWLDKIPEFIYVEKLRQKYNYLPEKGVINPIIGELDDPNNQRQDILTLSLSADGNTIIYGSAGNGKELLLTTLIYSTIVDHTPSEVNFYILDFGGETLRAYNNAPQVGDVILSSQEEKVNNLYKKLLYELDNRKKLFVDYNGDFEFYCKHSGKTLPMLIVIINNYDSYVESYEDHEEDFNILTREGAKYGIVFIVTANNTNTLRYKLRQNFKQNIVLQFNDTGDYSSILGNVQKKYPSKIYGRGLVSRDDIYEFQTAYPYQHEKMNEYIRVISKKLNDIFTEKAPSIPVLPSVVTHETVSNALGNLESVPVGIFKESLNIAILNTLKNYTSIVSSNDISEYSSFIKNLYKTFTYIKNEEIFVFDTYDIIGNALENTTLVTKNYEDTLNSILQEMSDEYQIYTNNNYDRSSLSDKSHKTIIIIGINELLSRISQDKKMEFTKALSMIKDLGTYHIVLIDNSDKLKQQAFETWYKAAVDPSNGVWLGSGILDQYALKLSVSPRELREELKPGFGVYVDKGKPYIIKLLEGDKDEQ